MISAPFFTVVVPTYNRAALIGKTLQSVFSQTYMDFEVVVVDDGSTDNTAEVVRSIVDARLSYHCKENGERAAARNFGILKAKDRYITFLDSDDLIRPEHLSTAYDYIRRHPGHRVVHLGYDIVDTSGRVLTTWRALPPTANQKLVEGNFLSCMGMFVEREVMRENLFNEDRALSGSEDYELWLRIAARHPIHTVAVSTGMLVQHDLRSVINMNPHAIVKRRMLLKKSLQMDQQVVAFYGGRWQQLLAYIDLYTSLHLALTGRSWWSLRVLAVAMLRYPFLSTRYRFWVAGYKALRFAFVKNP